MSGHTVTAWDIQAHSSPNKQSTRILILDVWFANKCREYFPGTFLTYHFLCFNLLKSASPVNKEMTNFWILLKSRNELFRWGSTQTNYFLIKRRTLVDPLHPLPLSLIISVLISGRVATLHDFSIIRDQCWWLWLLIMMGRRKGGRNWSPPDNFHLSVWIGSSPTFLKE